MIAEIMIAEIIIIILTEKNQLLLSSNNSHHHEDEKICHMTMANINIGQDGFTGEVVLKISPDEQSMNEEFDEYTQFYNNHWYSRRIYYCISDKKQYSSYYFEYIVYDETKIPISPGDTIYDAGDRHIEYPCFYTDQ